MRRIRTLAAVAAATLLTGVGPRERRAHAAGPPLDRREGHRRHGPQCRPRRRQARMSSLPSGSGKVKDFTIEGPDRIVLDLAGARLARPSVRRARAAASATSASRSTPGCRAGRARSRRARVYKFSWENEFRVRVSVLRRTFVAWSTSGSIPAASCGRDSGAQVRRRPTLVRGDPAEGTRTGHRRAYRREAKPPRSVSDSRSPAAPQHAAPHNDYLRTAPNPRRPRRVRRVSGRTIVRGKAVRQRLGRNQGPAVGRRHEGDPRRAWSGRDRGELGHHRRRQLREHPRCASE